MDKLVAAAGSVTAVSGVVLYDLLEQLQTETFRADLPPYFDFALVVLGAGVILVLLGFILPNRPMKTIDTHKASRYFGYAALANTVAAALFAIPVLIPVLRFPILITRWPGVYMVMGYTLFVLVGVLGTLGWSGLYRWLPDLLGKSEIFKAPFLFQFVATEFAVYLTSTSMFLGGYIGSSLVYGGAGDTVVGIAMEVAVIPSALGIFLIVIGSLAGVGNALLSRRS